MYIYLIISAIVTVISHSLFRLAAGSLSIFHLNPVTYTFYLGIILQTAIASVLIVTETDGHYALRGLDFEIREFGWLSVQYMMIVMPIGMLMAKWLFARGLPMRVRLVAYQNTAVDLSAFHGRFAKYALALLTLIAIISCIYTLFYIGYIPILKIFSIESTQILLQRQESSRRFEGIIYIRNILALGMTPVLAYAWIAYYIRTRRPEDLLIAICVSFLALNILFYNFEKAPVAEFFLGLLWLSAYCAVKIRMKHIIIFVSIAVILILIQYIIVNYDISYLFVYNEGPVGRVILSQAGGFYRALAIFPEKFDHIGFASLSHVLSSIFQMEHLERSARIVMEDFAPDLVAYGEAGVMSTIFLGEAWANFGMVGLLVSPLWVGFFVQSLYIMFLRMPKTPIVVAAFATFSSNVPVTSGFNDFIYPIWLAFLVVYILGTYFVAFWFSEVARGIRTEMAIRERSGNLR